MKIGWVVPGFSAHEREWAIPALDHFARALAANNRLVIFALEYPYQPATYSFFGATVHALAGRHRGKVYAPRLWANTFAAMRAEHLQQPFDVIHAFWVNEPGWLAQTSARILRVPFIASVAGGELIALRALNYGGQLDWIERMMCDQVMRNANCVTVGSRYLQTIAKKWRADISVLPLGVDTARFTPRARSESAREIKLLNVGSLVPVKGHENLLEAVAQIPEASLEIIGGGFLKKDLARRATELKISARVSFAGKIAHDALAEKYRAADVVAQSSWHEAQGMAILEAAACGCAIAGTRVGILPELAEQGGAIVTEKFASEELRAAIKDAQARRAELGTRARAMVEQDYALNVVKEKWIALYAQMAQK
ncbi:MAG: glycosyltransferase [Chloroflexi bacterium]|nr:glycosyltransferase [Chloroflexota bacterium]